MRKSVPWHHFEAVRADLATTGHRLLFGGEWPAQALLETVAASRVHPVCPILAAGELWFLIVDRSSAFHDLHAQPEVTLRTLQTSRAGDEFLLRGIAEEVHDAGSRALVATARGACRQEGPFEALFRLRIRSVLLTIWENSGTETSWPVYRQWQS